MSWYGSDLTGAACPDLKRYGSDLIGAGWPCLSGYGPDLRGPYQVVAEQYRLSLEELGRTVGPCSSDDTSTCIGLQGEGQKPVFSVFE